MVTTKSTNDLKELLFKELELLTKRRIAPDRARASASLGTAICNAADLEITHHRLRPRKIKPVILWSEIKKAKEEPKKRRR